MSTPTPSDNPNSSQRDRRDRDASGEDVFCQTFSPPEKRSMSNVPKPSSTPTRLTIDLTPNPAIKPSADLIAEYVAYADRFEIPRAMHEAVMITGIAALVNGKVR